MERWTGRRAMRARAGWPRVCLAGLASIAFAVTTAEARPILREADLRVTWLDPVRCQAEIALRVDTDAPAVVDHRVLVYEGSQIEGVVIGGDAVDVGASHVIGRTQALAVRLPRSGRFSYQIRYRAINTPAWAYRCPVWLPAAATDGLSRDVHVRVELPPDATPTASTLPRLTWTSVHVGEATLGHVPALVRAPFERPGEPLPWSAALDPARLMDVTTVIVLAAASLWLAWRRRRATR